MSEKEYEVETIGIDYICDECKSGSMEAIGNMLMTDPPKFQHKCEVCGNTEALPEKYPTVRFRRVDQY